MSVAQVCENVVGTRNFILFSHPMNNAVFPPQIIRCILGIIKAGNRNDSYS